MRAARRSGSPSSGSLVGGAMGAALGVAALLGGCDLPVGESHDGPRVVGVTPDLSRGPVDRLVSIRIALDRRIAPGSIPQGVVEITSGANYVWLEQEIDVVDPALVVTPQDPLDPDVTYQMVVHSLRDLDGHVSADTTPVFFRTSQVITPRAPSSLTYADVAPTLEACASCHGGERPVLGLDLSSAEGVRTTALGIDATEVRPSVVGSLGAEVTVALLGAPRIDRHDAAWSYLLYTMLGDPHVAGAQMPPDGPLASHAELRQLQEWIHAGSPGL